MSQEAPPADVVQLAERRAQARAARDFTTADLIRAEIEHSGWLVRDAADGFTLAPKPPYDVLASVRELPDRSAEPDSRPVTVAVLVEGWPDDVRRCLGSVLEHTRAPVLALDLGDVDGAGAALHEFAGPRVEAFHVDGSAGWAEARNALLRADTGAVQVWLDPSIELTGDAVMPLLDAFADESVVLAGGWGVDVDPDWLGFHDVPGPADVDAVLGYLLAVRRSAALAAGGVDPKARFYRNAELTLAFALRAAGGRAVATAPLPSVKHQHRGYHDTDPAYRDRESKRNYDHFLARYRGRDDLRTRR